MRMFAIIGLQMQATAVGWQVYALARETMSIEQSAFLLGLIGLAQFVPLFIFGLIGGQAADRFNRKMIILIFALFEVFLSLTLFVSTGLDSKNAMVLIFIVAGGFGLVRAFMPAAMTALGPTLVPPDELPQAIAWNSLAWQSSSVIGPAIGGLLYFFGAHVVYLTSASLQTIAAIIVFLTVVPTQNYAKKTSSTLALIKEGLDFVWNHKIVLGAISLDLAVVLLAGATALLPVYAKDILHAGPAGLGILRASMAVGATSVALALALNPIRNNVGKWMFAAVIVFGLATIAFGLSKVFWVSVLCLFIAGAADMISVYVRANLIQTATPDNMRGRVSAVGMLFISASNELGEFQSGVAARLLGPINAVLFGGIGAVIVAGIWVKLFKPLAEADRLEDFRSQAKHTNQTDARHAS